MSPQGYVYILMFCGSVCFNVAYAEPISLELVKPENSVNSSTWFEFLIIKPCQYILSWIHGTSTINTNHLESNQPVICDQSVMQSIVLLEENNALKTKIHQMEDLHAQQIESLQTELNRQKADQLEKDQMYRDHARKVSKKVYFSRAVREEQILDLISIQEWANLINSPDMPMGQ
jgi:hypothetical protein